MFPLDDHDRAVYEWQLWVSGFGEAGQQKLKNASVLVSRCGGVGGNVALQLAAAGVGRIVLAHEGEARLSDLNRQILMTNDGIGRLRIEQAAARLQALNPRLIVEGVNENVHDGNVERLVSAVDVVASCAPLFEERLAMNRAAVRQGKPLVDAAMFELETQLVVVRPGKSACLACLYPEPSPSWKRRFPVFGTVAGTIGCMGAMEVLKLAAGFGQTLDDEMLVGDLGTMTFRKVRIQRRRDCDVCGDR